MTVNAVGMTRCEDWVRLGSFFCRTDLRQLALGIGKQAVTMILGILKLGSFCKKSIAAEDTEFHREYGVGCFLLAGRCEASALI